MTLALGTGAPASARFWTVQQPTGIGTVAVAAWRADLDATGNPVALAYVEPGYVGKAISDLGRSAFAAAIADLGITPSSALDLVLRQVPG